MATGFDYPSVVRYGQRQVISRDTKALVNPLGDPQTPVGECEVRICGAVAGDPDALVFPTEHAEREHALRMVAACHSCHTLVNRLASSGTGCYKAWAPANPEDLLDNMDAPVAMVADMVCVASFSLGIAESAGGSGYTLRCVLANPGDAGGDDLVYNFVSADVPAGVRKALTWVYSGYPLVPGRPGMYTPGAPVVAAQEDRYVYCDRVVYSDRVSRGETTPGVLRRCAGWLLRWPGAYGVTGVYVLGALAAAAHGWLGGLYSGELLDIARGCVCAAVGGTVFKYTGVFVASGLTGVVSELER